MLKHEDETYTIDTKRDDTLKKVCCVGILASGQEPSQQRARTKLLNQDFNASP